MKLGVHVNCQSTKYDKLFSGVPNKLMLEHLDQLSELQYHDYMYYNCDTCMH